MTTPSDVGTPSVVKGGAITVALCFLVAVLEGFDIQAMGVAAPKLGAELKLAKDVLGEALSAANIGLVLGAILGGWLADQFGRKAVLIGAVLGFGVFTLLTMHARGFELLFLARLGAGFGFGAALPNIMALSAEVAPQGKRGSTGTMMFCGMPVGGGVVALISYLGLGLDWRHLFLIGGLAPLLLAPLIFFLMKEPAISHERGVGGVNWRWLAVVPLYAASYLLLAWLETLPGMGSIGALTPWLAALPTVIVAYMVLHREALFGEGRALQSVLLWAVFFPTLLILYLVLNWLPTLVIGKGFAAEASLASVWFTPPAVEQVIVTAARLPPAAAEAAFSIVHLGERDLAKAQRVDEAVGQTPGVSLFRRTSSLSANPTTQGISLRAIAPSGAGRTLVTLDGVPLNDPFGGWVIWSQLAPESLTGIDIVRGAGAGPYGAGALTGVIG
jgi:MFS family permease